MKLPTLHSRVEAPSHDRLGRVFLLAVHLAQFVQYFGTARQALVETTRSLLINRPQICQTHKDPRHPKMGMRIYKSWEYHLVLKTVVNLVGIGVQPRPHTFQSTD